MPVAATAVGTATSTVTATDPATATATANGDSTEARQQAPENPCRRAVAWRVHPKAVQGPSIEAG